MARHLLLRFEAPLMAFGREMVDARGPIRDFPAGSMLTGLLANALGLDRRERNAHQRLQNRLVVGSRLDDPGGLLRDFQTAQLAKSDTGWTTRGEAEGRAGGAGTYDSPHIRERDYLADACLTVALRLNPDDENPNLDDIATALREPVRPLFLGRKPCMPTTPLLLALVEAPTVLDALIAAPRPDRAATAQPLRFALIGPAADEAGNRLARPESVALTDERNWLSGVHAGQRRAVIGVIPDGASDASMDAAP